MTLARFARFPSAAFRAAWVLPALLLALALLAPAAVPADEIKVVTVGVIDSFAPEAWPQIIGPTLERLREALPLYRFHVVEIEREEDLVHHQGKLDFFLSSSLFFWSAHLEHGASAVAAVDPAFTPDPERAVAGLVLVRRNNDALRSLKDLKGKTLAVTGARGTLDSVQGLSGPGPAAGFNDAYLALRGTLEDRGYHSARFFSAVIPVGWRNPGVPSALLAGAADAGVLSLCEYESLAKRGAFRREDFKPIEAALDPKSGCLATTDFYPGIVLAATPRADAPTVTAVAAALFAMPPVTGNTWMVANDFRKTDELARALAIGPYAYLQEITPRALWRRFPLEILLAAALGVALLWHLARVNSLVLKRTAELREALEQRDALERKSRQNREHLAALEKMGLINQLSSLIAHELKQPLGGAIANYASGLQMHFMAGKPDLALTNDVLQRIREQVDHATDVIDYVRSTARSSKASLVRECDLAEILRAAVESFTLNFPEGGEVRLELPAAAEASEDAQTPDKARPGPGIAFAAPAAADPKAVELAVYNLVKNGAEACAAAESPCVVVTLADAGEAWEVAVRDNGPRLTDDAFRAIGRPLTSVKDQGLGLGLTLVRHMLERNGAKLAFERDAAGGPGLTARFRIEKAPAAVKK